MRVALIQMPVVPDKQRNIQTALAKIREAADNGATIVLNAANEIAVEAFLEGRIGFTDIFSTVRGMLESILAPLPGSVDEIIELDRAVRAKTRERLAVR